MTMRISRDRFSLNDSLDAGGDLNPDVQYDLDRQAKPGGLTHTV